MNSYVLFCLLCAFPPISGKYHFNRLYDCKGQCPLDSHHACLNKLHELPGAAAVCAKCGDITNPPKAPVNCSAGKLQCAKSGYQCIDVPREALSDFPNRTLACCHCPYVKTAVYSNKFLSHPSKELCKEMCRDSDGACRQTETGCWVCIYSLWNQWHFWLFVVILPPILFASLVMAPFLVIASFKHKQRKQIQQNQH